MLVAPPEAAVSQMYAKASQVLHKNAPILDYAPRHTAKCVRKNARPFDGRASIRYQSFRQRAQAEEIPRFGIRLTKPSCVHREELR